MEVQQAITGTLTSGLGAATEPGHVKVTNSWHLLWTTKLQTGENRKYEHENFLSVLQRDISEKKKKR